jgi:hypothetical protein
MHDDNDGLEVLGRLLVLAMAAVAVAVAGFLIVKFW